MDRDYWRRSIKRWFKPHRLTDQNEACESQEEYSGGEKEDRSNPKRALRGIRVWVAAHRPGGRFEEEDRLHSFYGNILVIGEDDNLVLLDESRAPTLIPWFTVRYIEVD